MDLIIVNENINYTKSLREYCSKSSKFKNVVIFRNFKELLGSYIPKRGILLFEIVESNIKYFEELNSNNSDLTLVAFGDEETFKLNNITENISSVISKNDKPQKILEQIELIIDGKRILPKGIFDKIKSTNIRNSYSNKKENKFNNMLKNIFN